MKSTVGRMTAVLFSKILKKLLKFLSALPISIVSDKLLNSHKLKKSVYCPYTKLTTAKQNFCFLTYFQFTCG
jgi:hypothetical protein